MNVAYERCVRSRAVGASCQRCVDACPTYAVRLGGPRAQVEVRLDDCVDCGLCAAVCPTQAVEGALDVRAWVGTPRAAVGCGVDGLPCVGALAVEDWILLGRAGPVSVRAADDCPSAWPGHAAAADAIAEANAVLAAHGVGAPITLAPPAPASPLPRPAEGGPTGWFAAEPRWLRPPARLDTARLRVQAPPERRAHTLAALPPSPAGASVPLTFTSAKRIDADTCTGCMACVPVCPTGALSHPRLRDAVRFDVAACVRCGLCHDVCAPGAITLAPTVELAALRAGPTPLVRLRVRLCGECGQGFKADGGALCPSCRAQEDEARDLWGLPR